jgi:DNA-binding beta-propeller fold protein YncE
MASRSSALRLLVAAALIVASSAQPVDVPAVLPLLSVVQCTRPWSVLVRPDNGAIVAACTRSSAAVVQLANNTVTVLATFAQCPRAQSLAMGTDGAVVAACGDGGVVTILDASVRVLVSASACLDAKSVAVRRSDGAVIAACGSSGLVQFLNGEITTLANLTVCPRPLGVAIRPEDGTIFATCTNGGVLQVLAQSVTTLVAGQNCSGSSLLVRPSDGAVVVGCFGGGVIQISNVNATLTALIASTDCPNPKSLAIRPSDGTLVASCDLDVVQLAAGATGVQTIASAADCSSPAGIAVRPSDDAVIIACFASASAVVQVVNAPVRVLVPSTQCKAAAVAVRPSDGAVIIACAGAGAGGVIQTLGSVVTHLASAEECPIASGVAVQADGGVVASCSGGNGTGVLIVNGTVTQIPLASLCSAPSSVAVRESDGAVFFSCEASGVVQLLNGVLTQLATDGQCQQANGVAVRPSDGAVVMACLGSGLVQILNGVLTQVVPFERCSGATSVAFRASDEAMVVTCRESSTSDSTVRVVPPDGAPDLPVVGSAQCPAALAATVRPSDGAVLVACQVGIIQVVGSSVITLATQLQCGGATSVAVRPADNAVIVACHATGVLLVDPSCAGGFGIADGRCQSCPVGSAKPEGRFGTWCAPCNPGRVAPSGSSVACDAVAAGSYDPGRLPRVVGFPCAPGSVSEAPAATACLPCPPGRRGAENASACEPCETGRYASVNGSADCTRCSPVRLALGTAPRWRTGADELCRRRAFSAVPQRPLPASRAWLVAARPTRKPRAARRASPACTSASTAATCASSALRCVAAAALGHRVPLDSSLSTQGRYANGTAATTCASCPPGRHAATTGLSTCAPCAPGNYTATPGSPLCVECAPVCVRGQLDSALTLGATHRQGYFANAAGTSSCIACPAGTFGLNASQTSCAPCALPGYTQTTASRQCSSCNAGLYAVFRDAAAGVFSECRFCPEGADCPALSNMSISPAFYAVRDAATLEVLTYLCDGGRCAADGACGPHRLPAKQNPLCGQCIAGFSEWGGECVPCASASGGLVVGLLLLAWTCVFAIHVCSQSVSGSSALRIVMFFWQVALLIAGPAAWVHWAAFLDLNFLALGTGGGGGGGAECPFPASPHGVLVLQLLGPLLTFALLALSAAAHRAIALRWPPEAPRTWSGPPAARLQQLLRFEAAQYWRSAIALYLFTFNRVTRQCLDFFNCAALPGGSFVVTLPSVRCDEAAYRALVPLVVIVLAAYAMAVPAFMARKVQLAIGGSAPVPPRTARVWSVLYGPLRRGAHWWGLAQMLLRAVLVATAVFLRADRSARLAVLTLCIVGAALLLARVQPNLRAEDNRWELCTLGALAVLALSAIPNAPDGWLATVTLGTGLAAAAWLGGQGLAARAVRAGDDGSEALAAERLADGAADRELDAVDMATHMGGGEGRGAALAERGFGYAPLGGDVDRHA